MDEIEKEAYEIWLKTPMTESADIQGSLKRGLIKVQIEEDLKMLYELAEKYGKKIK